MENAISRLNQLNQHSKSAKNVEDISTYLEETYYLLFGFDKADERVDPNAFLKQAYPFTTTFLLENILPSWVPQFDLKRRRRLFDVFFTSAPPASSFIALCSILSKPFNTTQPTQKSNISNDLLLDFSTPQSPTKNDLVDTSVILNYVTEMLEFLLSNQKVVNIIQDFDTDNNSSHSFPSAQQNQLIDLMASLPDRLSNKLNGKKVPPAFFPENYFPNIIQQSIKAVIGNQSVGGCKFVGNIFAKLTRIGRSAEISRELLLCLHSEATNNANTWIGHLIKNIPDSCFESFFTALFTTAPKITPLQHFLQAFTPTLSELLPTNDTLRFLFENKFFLVKVFPRLPHIYLLELVQSISNTSQQKEGNLCLKAVENLAPVWGDKTFIKKTTYRQHKYMTSSLMFLLKTMSKPTLESQISPLIKGVQSHMDSTIPRVHVLGMIVAEKISLILDPSKPLSFEKDDRVLLREEEDILAPSEDVKTIVENSRIEPAPIKKVDIAESLSKLKIDNPADIFRLEGHKKQESAKVVDEDELQPYDLNDDESDLKQNITPHYLRDALSYLQVSSSNDTSALTFDRWEETIKGLVNLIRANPPELEELGISLTRTLLHMRNEFDIQNFELYRNLAMVALGVFSTESVIPYLTHEFYERNYTLGQRMLIIEIIEECAKELSNNITPKKEPPLSASNLTPASLVNNKIITINNNNNTSLIEETSPKKGPIERRWGSGRRVQQTQTNKFHNFSTLFFYPLLNPDSTSQQSRIAFEEPMLLSRLVHCLGIIIECSGSSIYTPKISHELFKFLWSIRWHDNSAVRRSVIFSLSRIVSTLPKFLFLENFAEDLDEIQGWLYFVAKNDVDDSCRHMSRALLFHLVEGAQLGSAE
eukprot:TRINITY_DN8010_c0_g1_i2.p1 TRINITY_DN8010_c0_g1~~TRINITY_DN8010_c0_g1_i2.p1  ORF type:complete len:874 (+),score=190.66 TRINITY_DN8010_c0_g1_i2:117-2738(+)